MFVEVIAACVRLELVQLTTESHVELPLRTASPNLLCGPPKPRCIEVLPTGECCAWRAAD